MWGFGILVNIRCWTLRDSSPIAMRWEKLPSGCLHSLLCYGPSLCLSIWHCAYRSLSLFLWNCLSSRSCVVIIFFITYCMLAVCMHGLLCCLSLCIACKQTLYQHSILALLYDVIFALHPRSRERETESFVWRDREREDTIQRRDSTTNNPQLYDGQHHHYTNNTTQSKLTQLF